MRIIVTGAAGFIGSHLTDHLLGRGDIVIGIDNFDPFYDVSIKENNLVSALDHPNFSLHRSDICEFATMKDIFGKEKPDLVVHIAAKAGVQPSIVDPIGYYQTNVSGTINILECCKKFDVKKFVFASTSSIYGNNHKVPSSESDFVDHPISPYAASKKAAELLCHTYHHLYGIDIHALRFFTVYGPRQRPDLAIHKFFKLLLNDQPLPVFGDGTTSRDYTYIDDIISGLINSIDRVSGYEVINLGESKTISLNDLILAIEIIAGKTAKKDHLPVQPGDVLCTYADISKANRLLDYNPQTNIEVGLIQFYHWFIASES
jgi:UDP-glucuronate 4-epimerase